MIEIETPESALLVIQNVQVDGSKVLFIFVSGVKMC